MRLSSNRKSPYYDAVKNAHAHVYYEGIEVKGVMEADTDEGWIDLIVTDDHGVPIREGDRYKIERMHGEIEIKIRFPGAKDDE